MATVKKFEDLTVWNTARNLVNLIYQNTQTERFSRDFALRDQKRKAAISVMSNLAEGLDSGYDAEFIRFLGYSFRSTGEVQSQLYAALDQNYISEAEFKISYEKAVEIRKQIRSLINYLTTSKRSGRQFREERVSYEAANGTDWSIDLPDSFLTKRLVD